MPDGGDEWRVDIGRRMSENGSKNLARLRESLAR